MRAFPLLLEFLPLAGLHGFGRIHGLIVDLYVDNFS
jgi:hypothetical protein